LQRLGQALAERLTQDVDSVLRDVQLWLAPPGAPQRPAAPFAVPPSTAPSPRSEFRATAGGASGADEASGRDAGATSARTVSTPYPTSLQTL
jgi:hypothetical protein